MKFKLLIIEKMWHCIPIWYGILTSFLINICFFKVVLWVRDGIDGLSEDTNNLDFINQISRDWSTAPFIDIVVTNETTCPESHPDIVFSRPFYGTDSGCNCLGVFADMEFKDKFGQPVVKNVLRHTTQCTEDEINSGC